MIDPTHLNQLQTMQVYTDTTMIDPEPQQLDTFLPPPRMPTLGVRAIRTGGIDVDQTGFDEVKENSRNVADPTPSKEKDNRVFTTLICLIVLGGILQGDVVNERMKSTLLAISMVAVPLAFFANRSE